MCFACWYLGHWPLLSSHARSAPRASWSDPISVSDRMLLRHLLLVCPALAASLTVTPQHHRGPSLTPQLLFHRAAPPVLALPSTAALATASTIPTLLGFWKSEYGVSYAYGFAMAAAGAMHLSNPSPLAVAHAAVLLAYGSRLNLFLLYRELAIPRFREFREKIEVRPGVLGQRSIPQS